MEGEMMNYGTPIVNNRGIAVLDATAVSVTTDAVTFTLVEPMRNCVPVRGLVLVNLNLPIPEGTTETLPIELSLHGFKTGITLKGGNEMTVADFDGVGFYLMYYDRLNDVLQVI
jgi:hypothetical protein